MSLTLWQRMNSAWPESSNTPSPLNDESLPTLDSAAVEEAVNLRLAQIYADAEAIAADGDVLDDDELDDEVDVEGAIEDWDGGDDKFDLILEAGNDRRSNVAP